MVIKNVFNAEQFEWQGNEENIVRRIAALNDMESVSQINPPRVEELPKKRAAVFPYITESAVSLFRHRVPINVNTINESRVLLVHSLPSGTQHGDFVSVPYRAMRASFQTRVSKGTGRFSTMMRTFFFTDSESFL